MADILGTSGNDTLTAPSTAGWLGLDTVTLGAGADVLTIDAASPAIMPGGYLEVFVTDFTPGEDTLILQGYSDSWAAPFATMTLDSWDDWVDLEDYERSERIAIPSSDPRGGLGSVSHVFHVTDSPEGLQINARYIVDDGYIYTDGYEVFVTLEGLTLADLQAEPGPTAGNDALLTDLDHDLLSGLDGNDTLTALGNADTLQGDGGNDVLYARGAQDVLLGGAGNDRLYDLGTEAQLFGGEGDDVLALSGSSDTADGGVGNDTLSAVMTKTGEMTLTGGEGADTFIGYGFGGNTKLAELRITDFNPDEDRLELTIGGEAQLIDLYHLPEGFGLTSDDDGNQVLSWQGDGGTDRVVFEGLSPLPTIRLTEGDDIYKTPAGHEVIDAGAGDDTIYAFKGAHDIRLGDGNDAIWARHDAEIDGGAGDDTMHLDFSRSAEFALAGGEGADSFAIEHLSADRTTSAVISDYQSGVDHLSLDGVELGAGALPEGVTLSEDDDGNSILLFGESQSVTLLGVSNASFLRLDDGTEIPTVAVPEEAASLPEEEEELAWA